MLTLMYKLSKDEENVNRYRPEILLRTGLKVKMKLRMPFTEKERVSHGALITSVIVCGTHLVVQRNC